MATATASPLQSPPSTPNNITGGLSRWTPSLPTNMLTMLNPFAPSEPSKATPELKEPDGAATTTLSGPNEAGAQNLFWKRPIFTAILPRPSPAAAASPSRTSVMFAEPDLAESEIGSREGSVSDNGKRAPRKVNKPKSSFSICHPPPASSTRQMLHRRPRSLLQLHRLSAKERPVPAFEVIPSTNFSMRLTRSITKVYKTKHGLCTSDLVVLRAEKYYTQDREEEQRAQDVVALICRGRKEEAEASTGKARIFMGDGQEWEASHHASGGYEFVTSDDHGLVMTVRWVPKRGKDGKPNSTKRFNFSTISPNSRRHPVIASLSSAALDINDTYKIPDPTGNTPLSTPLSTPQTKDTFLGDAMEAEGSSKEESVTDDKLRAVIVVTSIWVTIKEGWSPNFKYEEREHTMQRSPSMGYPPKDGNGSVDTPPGSPTRPLEKRGSIKSVSSNLLRRSSILSVSQRNSTVSIDSVASIETANGSQRTSRARSDSASTVLVHRAASNRRRNNHQATWRPDLLNAQNTLPETSREDLSRTPKHERLSTIESPGSAVGSPGSPVSRRGQGLSSPLGSKGEESESRSSPVKRESSTATTTTTNSEPSREALKAKSSGKKKSRRWRKILCIS